MIRTPWRGTIYIKWGPENDDVAKHDKLARAVFVNSGNKLRQGARTTKTNKNVNACLLKRSQHSSKR